MPDVLHRRRHSVSHFQAALLDNASRRYPEIGALGALVTFAPGAAVVTTAWDENGTVAPLVEISVSGYGCAVPEREGLAAIATAPFTVGGTGVAAGNWVSGDIAEIAVPAGEYLVTVLADTLEAYKARRVRFHLEKA